MLLPDYYLALEKVPKAAAIFQAGSLAPVSHLNAFNMIPGTAQRDGRVDTQKFT